MKVAVIGWELPPAFSGGLGIHTSNIFSIIGKMIPTDIYLPDMGYSFSGYPFNIRTVQVTRGIAGGSYSHVTNFTEAVDDYNQKVVENFRPDGVSVVHCHDWITFSAGIEIKEKFGIPLVVTFHSTEYDRSAYFNPQSDIMKREKEGAEKADAIITVSNLTKKILVEKYNIDPDKITAVYNGVKSSAYTQGQNYKRERQILYFGRITSQKGPKFFMEMADKILQYEKNVKFVMAGTGDMLDEMKVYALDHGFREKILFPGFVDFHKAIEYYKRSEVFVIPAVSEPFGITVLESMVSGTPVIMSKTTGVGEALNNALKSEYWDTDVMSSYAVSIINHKSLMDTLSLYGKYEGMSFTWEKSAIKTIEVYRSIWKI
ncbi:MAG: glycosyltransferase family 4 protein [Candidatus Thermoplasmatota archaeon]|uniref:glycosyltransferase family 4 protein n=1 Tax=Ferroplasma sp. TaxID=2591003 RepID=UPI0026085597|nr:glycosyltransferase family 4 protein [Ferroplasma sp.]MCL4312446.1 glycosyltransferase family 4 protein [Candidatus Thermoplasmatota archaeon]